MLERSPVSHAQTMPDIANLQRVRLNVRERRLTKNQIAAVHAAMQLFVEEDIANGLSADIRRYCDACEQPRPAPGFIRYERYAMCNACAVEYELAVTRGNTASPGQFVRGMHFGEISSFGWLGSPQR